MNKIKLLIINILLSTVVFAAQEDNSNKRPAEGETETSQVSKKLKLLFDASKEAEQEIAEKPLAIQPKTLHAAVETNDIEAVKSLLAQGADKDERNEKWQKPLHIACGKGYIEIVDLLIKAGDDVNDKDENGNPPIYYAIIKDHKNIVELLLKNKANVNDRSAKGYSHLHSASFKGNIGIVNLLIENKADLLSRQADGATPLDAAVEGGKIETAKRLLELKANPNSRDRDRETPLMHAAAKSNCEMVKLLVENKAEVNAEKITKATALQCAIHADDSQTIDFLIKNGADKERVGFRNVNPLQLAAGQGKIKAITALAEAKADLNAVTKFGNSPLALAIQNKKADAVRTLLALGADKEKCYLLHAACFNDNLEILNILIDAKCDVNCINPKGFPVLEYAVQKDNPELIKALVKGNANINILDGNGDTPLIYAVLQNKLKAVKTLIELKADLESTNQEGLTPLLLSINKLDMLKELISAGANVNAKTKVKQSSALHIAALIGNLEAVNLLIEAKADLDAQDKDGKTALEIAIEKTQIQIIELLIAKGANAKLLSVNALLHGCKKIANQELVALIWAKADLNKQDANGQTLLHRQIIEKYDTQTIGSLIETYISTSIADNEGKTALDYAFENGRQDIVKLILDKERKERLKAKEAK